MLEVILTTTNDQCIVGFILSIIFNLENLLPSTLFLRISKF